MDCTESTQPQNPASDNCNCSASWSVQPCRYSILLFCSRLCGHYIFGSADELCNFRAFLCIMFKGVMPTTEMQGSHCCYQMTKLACWPRVRLALSITCVRQRPNSVMIRSSCSMSDRRDCSPSSASATRHEHIASITSSVRKLYAGLITGQHTHIDNNSKMWHDAQNTARWTITLSHSAVSPQRYVWILTLCHGNRLAQLVEQQTCNPSRGSTTQWPWASHSHLCVCVIKHYNSLTVTMP